VLVVILLSVRQVRVMERQMPKGKYMVRLLDMRKTDAGLRWFPQKNASHGKRGGVRSVAPGGKRGASSNPRAARVARNFQTLKPAPQTMIQPEVPPDERVLAELPIPQAVVWTPGEITRRNVTTPAPQTPGAIQTKPTLAMPNHEITPSDVSLSTIPFETQAPMPMPGTTVPVNVSAPKPAQQLPETASKDDTEISPARLISMSDVKMDEGTAALPVVNEVAQSDSSGSPSQGQSGGVSVMGDDSTDSRENGEGAGQGAGNGGNSSGGADSAEVAMAGSGDGVTVDTGDSDGIPSAGSEVSAQPEHIVMPKNGQYGMVIVGASPQEDYAETAGLWTGRVVYTVYLQSDTAQNWILQYSLPRKGANTATVNRPDAPWPYDMMRPNLGSYKDVVLVHGFVSAAGRFERLSVAYPEGFAEAALLLRALQQWEFRPAMLQGEAVAVEVLLIVPGPAVD
jgi:hypothetical protein